MPAVDPALGFVLSAMVGHLFGYEAALAIDASARPLREAREVIERAVGERDDGDEVLRRGPRRDRAVTPSASSTVCAAGRYDGHLEASTAVRLAALLRDVDVRAPARGVPGGSRARSARRPC